MDRKDREERGENKHGICRLEWIALAMEAARQHREALGGRSAYAGTIVPIDAPKRRVRRS